MSGRGFFIINITVLFLCQGPCFGFVSWSMLDVCGTDISNDDYAGELTYDSYTSLLHTPQCSVTITPKPVNYHVPNRLMFYFTVFTYGGHCSETNLTVRDGRSVHGPGIKGLPDYLCSDTSLVTDLVYYTTTPSLTITYSSNTLGRSTSIRYVIKFISYHTDTCSSEDEHQCDTGHCIPSTYYCSSYIDACRDSEHTCTEEESYDESPFTIMIRYIGVVVVIIIMLSIFSRLLKNMRDKCCDSVEGCVVRIRAGCCSLGTNLRDRVRRLANCMCHICMKAPHLTGDISTLEREGGRDRTQQWVASTVTETSTDRSPDQENGIQSSGSADNNTGRTRSDTFDLTPDRFIPTTSERPQDRTLDWVADGDDISNVQIFHLLQALEDASQAHQGNEPPGYDELFTPDHVYIPPPPPPPVPVDSGLPVVPSYEEAIADTPAELIVNVRTLSNIANNENVNLNNSPSATGSIEQSADSTEHVTDVESTPTVIRRLQTEYGFEHPFDFETEFDHYYSSDSDWDMDSVGQSAVTTQPVADSENTPTAIRRLQVTCGFEHPFDFDTEFDHYYSTDSDWDTESAVTINSADTLTQAPVSIDTDNHVTDESSHVTSVNNNEMSPSDPVLEVDSPGVPPQVEYSAVDSDDNTGHNTIAPPIGLTSAPPSEHTSAPPSEQAFAPPSEQASSALPSEPPPPYEDRSLPPYYYDYIANVSMYKSS